MNWVYQAIDSTGFLSFVISWVGNYIETEGKRPSAAELRARLKREWV